jgi:hypothetical protein
VLSERMRSMGSDLVNGFELKHQRTGPCGKPFTESDPVDVDRLEADNGVPDDKQSKSQASQSINITPMAPHAAPHSSGRFSRHCRATRRTEIIALLGHACVGKAKAFSRRGRRNSGVDGGNSIN